ncbi:hypothetical protein F4561_002881 [Lipingzhangella halophila]|uniref:Uncharacterized protein n=1 Tax=Lipingzhangella halophila TaxID=1783352 RepID=A0A7W7RHF3_9ACTN|nr:hypothetical protein [Lipingzhangella halophila]MBB4932061.1 hypothetical protein [Lipingzhangella halophila]
MGLLASRKVEDDAQRRNAEDRELAERLPALLEAVASAERELYEAHNQGADYPELKRRGMDLDRALTEAMRAAYARQRVLIGPRGHTDRIYRRKRLARPDVKEATELAERLLTERETHRLHGIEEAPRSQQVG